MSTLASDLRNRLERVVIDARDAAEAGADAALEAWRCTITSRILT